MDGRESGQSREVTAKRPALALSSDGNQTQEEKIFSHPTNFHLQ